MGSQRAANEIWTAEPRLRDLREGSVVRHTKLMLGDSHKHTHIYIHERIHTRAHMLKDSFIFPHKMIGICTWTHTCMHTF